MTFPRNCDAVLVMMPFGPTDRPSLGLSLLARCLGDAGFSAAALYPNLDFERRIGPALYEDFSLNFSRSLAAEWLFSQLLDPVGGVEDFTRFLIARCGDNEAARRFAAALPGASAHAAALLDDWTRRIIDSGAAVAGLSSCFHQHTACLALAKRIKAARPDMLTVLGGVNCNDPMGQETFRRFPFLDAVITGPGEIALVELTRRRLAGERPGAIPGVRLRQRGPDGETTLIEPWPAVAAEPALDRLPPPDFDDYFAAAQTFAVEPPRPAIVPVETSRGCWWGQKNHCVFCSENGHAMRYRAKSPDRALAEFQRLAARYPGCRIHAADEILDLKLVDAAMARLAETPGERRIFFSIKANIRKEQLQTLRGAGVDHLQPGIESLDDDILGPMKKGVSTLQCIQLLKWCRELGITVSWAILTGFPFERADAYDRMARLVLLLTHLQPPMLTTVSLQRFSPLYEQAGDFGLHDVRPDDAYRFIYNCDADAVGRLAYRFQTDAMPCGAPDYARDLQREVNVWRRAGARSFLVYHDDGRTLVVGDARPAARRRIHRLTGTARTLLLACDQATARHRLTAAAPEDPGAVIDALADAGLLIERDELLLALPAKVNQRCLPPVDLMADMLAAQR
jgi:ribosomal peptide maturation radical SAM protein 1